MKGRRRGACKYPVPLPWFGPLVPRCFIRSDAPAFSGKSDSLKRGFTADDLRLLLVVVHEGEDAFANRRRKVQEGKLVENVVAVVLWIAAPSTGIEIAL